MGTEVLKSFGTLQFELEQAKISLKGVDENIKKLIGRDPSENQSRPGAKRAGNHGDEPRGRGRGHNNQNFTNNRNKQNFENDEPASKKRVAETSVFKRLSDRPPRYFEDNSFEMPGGKQQLISKVIVTPKEVPSRQDVLAAQSRDEKSKARNRRMFGALLGTLQKFRQEETKLKPKEEKRAQVEKKLEEQQIKEREDMKKERQDLFFNRKRKQAEIRMIELKMTRMKEHTEWEEKQRPLMNFIQTKSKPHIYFLPKNLNEKNKELLETCRKNTEKMIDRKRQEVFEELSTIEQRMKRNFSQRQGQNNTEKHDEEEIMDHEDENEEIEDNHDIETVIKQEIPELEVTPEEVIETQIENHKESVEEDTTEDKGETTPEATPDKDDKEENQEDTQETKATDSKEDDKKISDDEH